MRKLLFLVILLPLFAQGQIKISALPTATGVNDADYYLLVQSGTTKKVAYSTFKYDDSDVGIQIGDSLTLYRVEVADQIHDSIAAIPAGTSISFGTQYQIPYTNSGATDFDYSSNFSWNGTYLKINKGTNNIFIGDNAGTSTTGRDNTFNGYYSGNVNTTGDYNTFIGSLSGSGNTTANGNVFVGYASGRDNTTGYSNTFTGFGSGFYNTTGHNNSFYGYESGKSNTDGDLNVFMGNYSGNSNTTGLSNSFYGYQSGKANISGSNNAFYGYRSGTFNTTGDYNTFTGNEAGYSNTTSDYNTYNGYKSGRSNTTGYENSFYGVNSGYTNTTGYRNTAIGNYAGYNNSTGNLNVFLGYQAGQNETGSNKLYISNSATDTLIYGEFDNDSLRFSADVSVTGDLHVDGTFDATLTPAGNDTEIQYNSAGGLSASSNFTWNDTVLNVSDGVNENVFIGPNAGDDNTSGYSCVSIGFNSLTDQTTGYDNSSFGYESGSSTTEGYRNTFIGGYSGYSNLTGDYNVFVGFNSGYNSTGNYNVFLGQQAGYNETGSNKLYIENSNISNPLIKGDFASDELWFNTDTTHIIGHSEIDSNLYVVGSIMSEDQIYTSGYLPEDSATVTTATLADTYYFVKGNFIIDIGRSTDRIVDTLYIDRPQVDSVLIQYNYTATVTSSKSATVRTGVTDNGIAVAGTTKSASFSVGESKSITHFGTLWVEDNDFLKFVVSSSVSANNITMKEVSLIIEEKYTSENYNR